MRIRAHLPLSLRRGRRNVSIDEAGAGDAPYQAAQQ